MARGSDAVATIRRSLDALLDDAGLPFNQVSGNGELFVLYCGDGEAFAQRFPALVHDGWYPHVGCFDVIITVSEDGRIQHVELETGAMLAVMEQMGVGDPDYVRDALATVDVTAQVRVVAAALRELFDAARPAG